MSVNLIQLVQLNKESIMATRKKRLNKAQQLEKIVETATETIIANQTLFKKDKMDEMLTEMIAALTLKFSPKKGGGTSNKINKNGEVYCNYFDKYLPADKFGTKQSKPNKITGERVGVYKANCKEAEAIIRKVKALKLKVTKQATEEFRNKRISEEKYNKLLDDVDKAVEIKYENIYKVPTVFEVVKQSILEKPVEEEPTEVMTAEELMDLADEIEATE